MPREKIKFAMRIKPETQELVREWCPKDNCQSQNEFIEKAIHFYVEHLSVQSSTSFLPSALVSALRATLQGSENRIARLLFKLTVEIGMMMNVLAAGLEIDSSQLDDLRWRCVQDVKQTNGTITFKDTLAKNQDAE
ncbi:MAG: hypothetical protein K2K53_11360 [Oscillospiraceae bacterium]|nr:hypothetical protein [Oscillospiraceae bacterium]